MPGYPMTQSCFPSPPLLTDAAPLPARLLSPTGQAALQRLRVSFSPSKLLPRPPGFPRPAFGSAVALRAHPLAPPRQRELEARQQIAAVQCLLLGHQGELLGSGVDAHRPRVRI